MWLACFISIFIVLRDVFGTTVLPEPSIIAYEPYGIRVSLPNLDGMSQFFFWGNINEELESTDLGEIQLLALEPVNGEWVIQEDDIQLTRGDVIYYILFAKVHGVMHRLERKSYMVTEVLPRPPETTTTIKNVPTFTTPTSTVTAEPTKATISVTATTTTTVPTTISSTTRSTTVATTSKLVSIITTTVMPTTTPTTTATSPKIATTTTRATTTTSSTKGTSPTTTTATTPTSTTLTTPLTSAVIQSCEDLNINITDYSVALEEVDSAGNKQVAYLNPGVISAINIDDHSIVVETTSDDTESVDINLYV